MDLTELESLLSEAVHQQSLRQPRRKGVEPYDAAADYARRLAEKALYRRLLVETHIAQDGLRFAFWFSKMGDLTLDQWRELIDREMQRAGHRKEASHSSTSPKDSSTQKVAPQVCEA
jgi:hypothetical protein